MRKPAGERYTAATYPICEGQRHRITISTKPASAANVSSPLKMHNKPDSKLLEKTTGDIFFEHRAFVQLNAQAWSRWVLIMPVRSLQWKRLSQYIVKREDSDEIKLRSNVILPTLRIRLSVSKPPPPALSDSLSDSLRRRTVSLPAVSLSLPSTTRVNHNTIVYQYRSRTRCHCVVPAHYTHSVIPSIIHPSQPILGSTRRLSP